MVFKNQFLFGLITISTGNMTVFQAYKNQPHKTGKTIQCGDKERLEQLFSHFLNCKRIKNYLSISSSRNIRRRKVISCLRPIPVFHSFSWQLNQNVQVPSRNLTPDKKFMQPQQFTYNHFVSPSVTHHALLSK